MKLGIKIVFTSTGVQNGPAFNNTDVLNRYASDMRPYLRKVFPTREELRKNGDNPLTSFDESSKIVLFLKFIGEQGYIISIVKAGPEQTGRVFDNTAVWIHFPLNVDISNKETQDLLQGLSEIISNPSGIDHDKLKSIADRDYYSNDANVKPLMSKGDKFAVVNYGRDTAYQLSEILGSTIRQPDFAKYEAVFLIDNSLQLRTWNTVANLNSFRIRPMVQVKNPGEKDGFKPYIGDTLFAKPIEIIKGEKLTVVWKREGFVDVKKEVDTNKDANATVPYPQPNEINYIFHKNWFQVVNDKKEPVKNFQLSINGKNFDNITNKLVLNYDSIKGGYKVVITATGYDQLTENVKFQQPTGDHVFKMNKTMHHYEFVIPAYDDRGNELETPVRAQLDTNAYITHCPIKGYDVKHGVKEGNGDENKLNYCTSNRKAMLFSVLVGATAVALIWGVVALFQHFSNDSDSDPVKVEKPAVVTKPSDSTVKVTDNEPADNAAVSEEAINYLSKDAWIKAEMEDIEDLKGLYDDMNEYKFDNLIGKWHVRFKDVDAYKPIYELAIKCREIGKPVGKFNSGDDTRITVRKYCQRLEKVAADNGGGPTSTSNYSSSGSGSTSGSSSSISSQVSGGSGAENERDEINN